MTTFSRRTEHDRAHNAVSRALAVARARGTPLLELTVSNPTVAGIPYANGVATALTRGAELLHYEPDPYGLPSARHAVCELWRARGFAVDASNVALTASTSEAYAFVFKLFCDPGDEVLVPVPSYPLFEHLAVLEGVRLVPYRLDYDGAWFVDLDSVARAVTPRTRAVLVVSPNNPTGSFVARRELAALAELGLPIVSDEVFGEYSFAETPAAARSALETDATLVVALDGLSKLAALPQMKLAWMTLGGPPALVEEARARLELILDTFLSPSTPVQVALPELLATRHVAQHAIRARLHANLVTLERALLDSPLTLLRAAGGWSAILRLPSTLSDEAWTLAFLEAGVVVQPGYFFDLGEHPYAVVSLLTPETTLRNGIERIVACVADQA